MARAYLGLGTNLGDREKNIRDALAGLEELGTLVACSSVYETEPWGVREQPDFLNLCCALETDLPPRAFLDRTAALERRLGRRRVRRWGPRLIDVDLLLYDDLLVSEESLTVPHPRLAERAFVLLPLEEIAGHVCVPGLNATVAEMRARLGDVGAAARRVAPPPCGQAESTGHGGTTTTSTGQEGMDARQLD